MEAPPNVSGKRPVRKVEAARRSEEQARRRKQKPQRKGKARDPKQAHALVSAYAQGYSLQKVADAYGVKPGAVRAALRQAGVRCRTASEAAAARKARGG
jgi:DNA-directed RNA polymerase specialized sigma24 family protein